MAEAGTCSGAPCNIVWMPWLPNFWAPSSPNHHFKVFLNITEAGPKRHYTDGEISAQSKSRPSGTYSLPVSAVKVFKFPPGLPDGLLPWDVPEDERCSSLCFTCPNFSKFCLVNQKVNQKVLPEYYHCTAPWAMDLLDWCYIKKNIIIIKVIALTNLSQAQYLIM